MSGCGLRSLNARLPTIPALPVILNSAMSARARSESNLPEIRPVYNPDGAPHPPLFYLQFSTALLRSISQIDECARAERM